MKFKPNYLDLYDKIAYHFSLSPRSPLNETEKEPLSDYICSIFADKYKLQNHGTTKARREQKNGSVWTCGPIYETTNWSTQLGTVPGEDPYGVYM